MTLNKQRILSELGSVMNQLQSADCGCMGKLFSNSNQGGQAAMGGTPLPACGGYRHSCCYGHGYNPHSNGTNSVGEPYAMNTNNSMHSNNMPDMGYCNPPKLYADTYNYLSDNLMKPVVQEVYNDLKTITPANTVMNNPLGTQMGLSQGNINNTDNPNMNMVHNKDLSGGNMGNMLGMDGVDNMKPIGMGQSQPPMNNLGGMGPQIVNMFTREGQNLPGQSGQLATSTPQSQIEMGVSSLNPPTNSNPNQLIPNMNSHYGSNINKGQHFSNSNNMGSSFNENPAMQHMTQAYNEASGANAQTPTMGAQRNAMQSNITTGNMQMGNINAGPAAHQTAASNNSSYGQHTQGMMKFNEMFPGVMQGDLGFDPMSIAIQMNPANKQKVAIDTMTKFLNNNPLNRVMDSVGPGQTPQNIQNDQQQPRKLSPDQQTVQSVPTGHVRQEIAPGQQQLVNTNFGAVQQQQQQIYNAKPDVPFSYQQEIYAHPRDPQNQQPHQNQYMVDPNTGAAIIPQTLQGNEGPSNPVGQIQPEPVNPQSVVRHNIVREPILPVDTSKIGLVSSTRPQYSEYNTLKKPNQISDFHQTISAQPLQHTLRNDPMSYSNVKSTVSKTSLMGNKPTSRTPSRSQLQHIYKQYKGSQSYTQQNIKSPVEGGATFSEAKLNVTQGNANTARAPVEKVGGDTAANNQVYNQIPNKVEQVMGQVGDVPPTPNQLQNDNANDKAMIPARQAKCRNGLQDVLYTSYPTSAAWSFHGKQQFHSLPVNRYYK